MMYRCILADPPWPERGGGKSKRGADRHYTVLSLRGIFDAMYTAPVWQPDPTGAHLWLWSTNRFLPMAMKLIELLGFTYVTNAVWVKPHIGLGQYLRHRHELLLLARSGKAIVPKPSSRLPSVIEADRREHSRKPDKAYWLIESTSPGPRAELFARSERDGWDSWGDEIK